MLGVSKLPEAFNEPMVHHYSPGTDERTGLLAAVVELKARMPIEVPCVVNGKEIKTGVLLDQVCPGEYRQCIARVHQAPTALVQDAIDASLAAKLAWETLPFDERAAVFLKAASLISGKYRYKLMAATMLGQGKNAWQAEIDAAAELADFFRFNCTYAEQMYAIQPPKHSPAVWNRVEYRALDGFVYAISPFNFTAIGGNLAGAPALLGNVVIWKPSPSAAYSNYLVHKILLEAGLPAGVIQFLPGDAEKTTAVVLKSPHFGALHYTGSTAVFRELYKNIALNLSHYKCYPRIVGETGGKNFHFVHESADIKNAVNQTIRGAFEYSGQKCSACSRLYVPRHMWVNGFKDELVRGIQQIKVGKPEDWSTFVGPVIHRAAFDRLKGALDEAKSRNLSILAGGKCDDSEGYYIHPTLIEVTDPLDRLMSVEFFGPVLAVYVYGDGKYEETLGLVEKATDYALTGALFAGDRKIISSGTKILQKAAGNFYINAKCTGAVVGQQPFGGAKTSGTNDKAGSQALLYRFVSMRSIKEEFLATDSVLYPSNAP